MSPMRVPLGARVAPLAARVRFVGLFKDEHGHQWSPVFKFAMAKFQRLMPNFANAQAVMK